MKPTSAVACALLAALFCAPLELAFAESTNSREIVVTASKAPLERGKFGGSIRVIDSEEIENSGKNSVAEILRDEPSLDVVRTGGPGGATTVFIRGANSEHTLFLLDGIELNNPVSNARFFNIANLSLENVERIEILRGPSSTVYGSDAIGGVINIISKKAGRGAGARFSFEGGSYDSFTEKASAEYGAERGSARISILRQDVNGVSAARSESEGLEDDPYENTAISGRFDIQISDAVEAYLITRNTDSLAAIDNAAGEFGDDPNRKLDSRENFLRTGVKAEFIPDVYRAEIALSYSDQRFDDNNDRDPRNPDDFLRSSFEGDLLDLELIQTLRLAPSQLLVFGLETERERAKSSFVSESSFGPFDDFFGPEEQRTNGYFLESLNSFSEQLSSSFSVRLDDGSGFDNEVTFRVAPSYSIEETRTRLRASFGSAFKAPSLYQRFSSFGNPELSPEQSLGWEFGFDQESFDSALKWGLTFYRNEIDDLITFDSQSFVFENINEASLEGFEAYAELQMSEDFSLGFDYSYNDAEDKETGEQLLRRAQQHSSVSLNYTEPTSSSVFSVSYRLIGHRFDNDFSSFPAARKRLPSYEVLDLSLRTPVSETLTLFARIDNLFDRKYEDVLGYNNLGLAAYGGFEVSL
jgi:vitamin B12 transporter